jgi:hypothetical protein
MTTKLRQITEEFNTEFKNLKKLILEKKAGVKEVFELKMKFVLKLLQVIFKR